VPRLTQTDVTNIGVRNSPTLKFQGEKRGELAQDKERAVKRMRFRDEWPRLLGAYEKNTALPSGVHEEHTSEKIRGNSREKEDGGPRFGPPHGGLASRHHQEKRNVEGKVLLDRKKKGKGTIEE